MKDTFGTGLLDERDCFYQGLLGSFTIFPLNSFPYFLDCGFHRAFEVKGSKPPLLILSGSFQC
jgi:hypothetical protein